MREASATAFPPTSTRRTVALTLSAQGRATRTELLTYGLSAALVMLAVSFMTALLTPYSVRALVSDGLTLLLAIPAPALLVRRLHDQGRSGRWVLLAVLAFSVWLVKTVIARTLGMDARITFDRVTWILDWAVILANLATALLAILPGTIGPNRFGPDPRQRSA